MARITVEDCLERVDNRFQLVLLAAKRAKQLLKGSRPLLDTDNKEVVTALREIAATKVKIAASDAPADAIAALNQAFTEVLQDTTAWVATRKG